MPTYFLRLLLCCAFCMTAFAVDSQPNALTNRGSEAKPGSEWLRPAQQHEETRSEAANETSAPKKVTTTLVHPRTSRDDSAKTGLSGWIFLGLACSLGLGAWFVLKKKNQQHMQAPKQHQAGGTSRITFADGSGTKRSRAGLSFVEVMISVAILSTVLMALFSNVFSMSMANRNNHELAKAHELSVAITERIQGATWHTLGSDSEPWSFHRVVDVNTPMTEVAEEDSDSLLSPEVGLLNEPTGLDNLQIWLEYRRMSMVEGVGSLADWETALSDPDALVDPASADINMNDFDDALVVRVLMRWESDTGGNREHELFVARRK